LTLNLQRSSSRFMLSNSSTSTGLLREDSKSSSSHPREQSHHEGESSPF
jgi:hypothetical protein